MYYVSERMEGFGLGARKTKMRWRDKVGEDLKLVRKVETLDEKK